MEVLYPALALLIGAGLAAAITYSLTRSRLYDAVAAAENRGRAEIVHLERLLSEREQALSRAEQEAVELREQKAQLAEEKARLSEKAEQSLGLKEEVEQLRKIHQAETRELNQALAKAGSTISTLNTRLEEQEKANAERFKQLDEAKTKMAAEFENLANRILDEKSRKFTDQNQTQLGALLNPMREQLDGFRKKVEEIHVADVKERSSLSEQLNQLRELNQQINQEAINLTRALKGDKKAQGNWGELILERVLEQSGLRKDIEYETQGAFRNDEGKLLKPDVVIRLPEGKDVVVDSKVSLLAYNHFVNAEDDDTRRLALREHVQAVRQHIDQLSGKDYGALNGLRSLDFVLMFMPIEPAFVAAFQADEKLFADAFEKRIVVVTPTTLLATLRTIENIWRYERRNEHARDIADRAGAVYDKLRGFVEELEKLGNQLDTVHGTYKGVMNKLTRGRGNLISQSQRFLELGVKVKKELPKTILEQSDIGSEENRPQETARAEPKEIPAALAESETK